MNAPQMGRRGQAWPSRWLAPSASQGAYVIRALPDLCLGIVSERLGHLDPWISFHGQLRESPGTSGAFFLHRASIGLVKQVQASLSLKSTNDSSGDRSPQHSLSACAVELNSYEWENSDAQDRFVCRLS